MEKGGGLTLLYEKAGALTLLYEKTRRVAPCSPSHLHHNTYSPLKYPNPTPDPNPNFNGLEDVQMQLSHVFRVSYVPRPNHTRDLHCSCLLDCGVPC